MYLKYRVLILGLLLFFLGGYKNYAQSIDSLFIELKKTNIDPIKVEKINKAIQKKFHETKEKFKIEEKKNEIEILYQEKQLINLLLGKKESELKQQREFVYFIAIVGLLLMVLVYVFFHNRSVKKQNKLKQELLVYMQKAVNQQMNPHFIFNTLNSIQYFLLNNDKISSSKYISKFAQLMRITLENSQNSLITLQTEIEAIKLYIELEQLRFRSKFVIDFNVGENMETELINIPPLMIQPYIENAIWHGLMHLENERPGKLTVEFSISDEILICVIEDNGIGRERAMAIKSQQKSGYRSFGMSITNTRISIINQIHKSNIEVKYIDLYDKGSVPSGTKVIIQVPRLL